MPDPNNPQGECNIVRTNAANLLWQWLAADPTQTGDPDAVIVGDWNAYAMEDPISTLKTARYTDLKLYFGSQEAYSYVFDGQWGYLDHALSSHTLTPQVVSVTDWHINADEPSVLDYNTNFKSVGQITSLYAPDEFRIADHDPVLIDLNPVNDPPTANAGGPYTADEGQTVALSATGSDPDGTPVTFAWDLNNDNVFETPGQTATFDAVDGTFDYTVNVQVTDATGLSSIASAIVTVNNVPPTVGTPAVTPEPSTEGSSVTAAASFSDPGVNDAPFTCTVNYGDGSGTCRGVSDNTCTGPAHTYPTRLVRRDYQRHRQRCRHWLECDNARCDLQLGGVLPAG